MEGNCGHHGVAAFAIQAHGKGQRGQVAHHGIGAEHDVAAALDAEGGAHGVGAVAEHQVVLDQSIEGLVVGGAVFAEQDEVAAAGALPVEKHVAPDHHIARAEVLVGVSVGILDHDVAGGVIADGSARGGKIVEENIVLDNHPIHRVDVDVLVTAVLVVEQVAAHRDVAGAVVDLEDVVVVAVVQDVVLKRDVVGFRAAAVLDLDHQCPGACAAVGDVESLDGNAADLAALVGSQYRFIGTQPGLVANFRAHADAVREIAANADAAVVGAGLDQDQAAIRDMVQRIGDGAPG